MLLQTFVIRRIPRHRVKPNKGIRTKKNSSNGVGALYQALGCTSLKPIKIERAICV